MNASQSDKNCAHPSTWEEAFHRTTVAVENHSVNNKITIGTWNVNALTPHVHEVLALDADVIALQEVRIGEDSLPSIRNTFKQYGYNLYVGALPKYKTQGHNKKSIHLDQTIPGVAFVVRCHIPVQEIILDSMSKWAQNGRLHAIQIFVQQKWINCFNAYAPTQNSAPFLAELSQTLGDCAHKCGILFGDINADSRNGIFAREINDKGWYPLTYDTSYDFYIYKHSNGKTSCIDIIAITDLLKETVAPVRNTHVLDKGHSFLSTSMHNSFQQNPLGKFIIKLILRLTIHVKINGSKLLLHIVRLSTTRVWIMTGMSGVKRCSASTILQDPLLVCSLTFDCVTNLSITSSMNSFLRLFDHRIGNYIPGFCISYNKLAKTS